ncbi:transcriptional regulator ATRX homolog [Pocillopora verrucosa]|uniref:transcriptional regulator ATRX homolog n=1 Tax=Pocillopora verrucosa TaxID=203993 RepID=UPI00333FDFFA
MMTLPGNKKSKENQKRKKTGKKNIIDSDSDEDSFPPKIRKATSVKKKESSKAKKNRRPISLDSVQSNLKRKKQLLHLISLVLLQLKGNPGKHLPKEKTEPSRIFFHFTQRSDESEENEDSKVNRAEEYKNGREKEGRENGNVNCHTTEQPSKKRKEDLPESKSEVKKPSPEKKKEVPKTTSISKLAAKAATVPETPVRDSKPSPKKTVTPKKDKKDVDKETSIKGTPKVSKSEEVVEVPPSLEKKNLATIVLWQEMVLGHLVQRKSLRSLGKY